MDDDVWREYFDTKEDVALPNGDVFRTYHAGGSQGPHVVLLHGGGYTSMTWCLTTAVLKETFTVHAIDLRGHGKTTTSNDGDLAMDTLVDDVVAVLARILPPMTTNKETESDPPQTILAGHSLGGAVAVRVAATTQVPSLVGVMVVDVVEGTAIASLEHMHRILSKRPQSFRSTDEAVHWALHSGTVRNADAAAVSVPSQLIQRGGTFTWRTDLQHSAPYWRGWFLGLSEQFLALKAAKILVLAGSDRLDTALMRGQMMGKFELRLLYGSGHAIQEDSPDQMAQAIVEFASRCARTVQCDRGNSTLAVGSAAQVLSSNTSGGAGADLLAERLAKARRMMPTATSTTVTQRSTSTSGTSASRMPPLPPMPQPAVMPKRSVS